MHRREALVLIQRDMNKFGLKEVGLLTDCRAYLNVVAKSVHDNYYRYIYDELSRKIHRYRLLVDLSTEVFIGTVESEVK